jgi:hypothetical protein
LDRAAEEGRVHHGAGLQPLTKATRVRLAGGKVTVTDRPFSEAKEVVGGYTLCEFKTHDEAVVLVRAFIDLHRIHWPEFEGESELRQLEGTTEP